MSRITDRDLDIEDLLATPDLATTTMAAALDAIPAIVHAAAVHARRAVEHGTWLQPSPTLQEASAEAAYFWARHRAGLALPSLAAHLVILDQRLTTTTRAPAFPVPTLAPPPREALAAALAARPHPGAPPPGDPGSAAEAAGVR